jgi:hypothetical protein
MTYVPATHGGFIGAVSNSALTKSENKRFVISPIPPAGNIANILGSSTMNEAPTMQNGTSSHENVSLRDVLSCHLGMSATGATSGFGPDENSVVGRSSIPEEQNGLTQASHALPTGNGNSAAGSSNPEFYSWDDAHWRDFSSSEGQSPSEDMSAASTASSCTAALGLSPDVNNAPLDGASQQIGNMALKSSACLTESRPGEGWDLNHPGVKAFVGEYMAEGSSTINDALPPVNGRYLVGGAQTDGQMGASNSASDSFAQDANFGGHGQQPQQTGASSSANNPVAPNATFGGFDQPQMQMGVGSSVNNIFAAQQQFFVAPNATFNGGQQQMALNGRFQPSNPQMDAAPQAYFYPVAANTTPYNGVMGQYPLPPVYQAGPTPEHCVGQQQQQQQQQQALNGNALPQMGQNWQAIAQLPNPFAAVRTRNRQGDAVAPRRRHRTGPAPAVQDAAVQVFAAPAAALAPAQQQVAAQEGPYALTAAGVPNRFPNRKGNAQGQTPGWSQALKHHNGRCDRLKLDGCVPDCELRAKWPQTWENWNTRRFQIRWEKERPGRPQEQLVSGFAVAAQGKFEDRFVVLGEIQADGLVGKQGKMRRVDKAAVVG